MYAIVDIETTGSYAAANGITEVAIHVFDGVNVVEKFETLVNPGQPIPHYIQAFTGISNEMVWNAPRFEDIAPKVYSLLHDKVFVAHNVNFDYSFIKAHLAYSGYSLNAKKLCTVRLGRKILPGFPSYSLGNICRALEIEITNRHRAGGDTAATVQLFCRILANDKEKFITKSLQRTSGEQSLPPNVPKEDFEKLPYTPGVYYFHDIKGKIIYVGKAKNIRQRVSSHFSNNSESRQKQNFIRHTYAISYQLCATELMACILESSEIKHYWPSFNYAQKRREDLYGIFKYEDRQGYMRLGIEKTRHHLTPVCTFHYLVEGHMIMKKLVSVYDLCPKLCFIESGNDRCTGIIANTCFGACEHNEEPALYNARVEKAITSLNEQPSYAIIDKGLQNEDQSCILVLNGKLFGMGYIPFDAQVQTTDSIKEFLQPYKENSAIRNLLQGYRSKYPSRIIPLTNSVTHSI